MQRISKFKAYYFYIILPILFFLGLRTLGFDGLYGQDSYEYIRYSNALKQYLVEGTFPGDVVWPKAYLFVLTIASFMVKSDIAGQLISLLSLYFVFIFSIKTIKLLYDHEDYSKEFLIVSLLLSPYLLRLGVVVMADTFAMLSISGAFYFSVRYRNEGKVNTLMLSVLVGFLGVFSRYAVLVPLMPIMLLNCYSWFKWRQYSHFLVILIPLSLFLLNYMLEGNGSKFLNHHLIESWSLSNLVKSDFLAPEGSKLTDRHYTFPNVVFYFFSFFHPGFSVALTLSAILTFKKWKAIVNPHTKVIIVSIILYGVFLSGISFQGNRYIALTYPLFVVLIYPLWRELIIKIKANYRSFFILGMILFQMILFYFAIQPSFQMNSLERQAAEVLRSYEGLKLYSFELDVSLQQRGVDLEYYSLWEKEYEQFETNALVLFNEDRFKFLYKDMNPMKNWEKLESQHHLILIEDLNDTWKLYRIE